MPALGSAILGTSPAADPFGGADEIPHVFTFSDGHKAAFGRITGPQSAYSLYNGSTWGAAVNLAADYLDSVSRGPHAFWQNGDTIYLVAANGAVLTLLRLIYDPIAHTMGAATTITDTLSAHIAGLISVKGIDVVFQSTYGQLYVALVELTPVVKTCLLTYSMGAGFLNLVTFSGTVSCSRLALASPTAATLFMTFGSAVGASTPSSLLPCTFDGGGFPVTGTLESITSLYMAQCAPVFDSTGNLDLVYVTGGTPNVLATIKRTGVSSYSSSTTIYTGSGLASTAQPALAYNSSTGDLWCHLKTTANQANGELYVARRVSGVWSAAVQIVGGDANGYGAPCAGASLVSGNADILYAYGSSSTPVIYYYSEPSGAAPDTPVVTAPSGSVTGLTSAASFTYHDVIGSDIQLAYEIRTTRNSDSHLMWDSGKVTSAANSGLTYGAVSNTGDANYHAPETQVYGTAYSTSVRVWDTVLGAASSYSALVSFTPVRGGTATITQIVSNAVTYTTSPATITGPDLTVTAGWAQPDGNHATLLGLQLLDASATIVLASTTPVACDIAPAGTLAAATWTPSVIANATTYVVRLTLTDGVSGLAATADFTVTTAFTPPSPPSTLVATPNPEYGRIDCHWTNGAGSTTTNLYWRTAAAGITPAGVWTPLASGTLRTAAKVYDVPLNTPLDLAVSGVSAIGIESSKAIAGGLSLGIKRNRYGVSLVDTTNPDTVQAHLGALSSWDQATGWDLDLGTITSFVPAGAKNSIESYDLTQNWRAHGKQWTIYDTDAGQTGTATIAALTSMATSHNTLLYRDADGTKRYVSLKTLHIGRESEVSRLVGFDLDVRRYAGSPVVS